MQRNGKITASALIYSITIALAVFATMALMTAKLSPAYNVADIAEFEEFEDLFNEFNSTSQELVDSQNYQDADNVTSNWFETAKDNFATLWEESLLRKGIKTIFVVPKLLKFAGKSVSIGIKQLGVYIPPPMIWLMVTMVALVIVVTLVKVYVRREI